MPGDPADAVSCSRSANWSCRMATENSTWGYTRIQGALTKCRPSRGAIDDSPDSEGGRTAARTGAPDVVAHVCEGALGQHCWRGFLHDRGVDVARLGHVLHGLHHRLGVTARPDPRNHAASRGALHGAGRADADNGRRCDRASPPRPYFAIGTENGAVTCGVDSTRRASLSSSRPSARRMRTPTPNGSCGPSKKNA